jgi:type I restriction enzyme S subunit
MEVREASAAYLATATPQVAKGYKQTEVGVIPEDWDVMPLSSLCEISAGRDLEKENFSPVQNQQYDYPIFSNARTNNGLYGFSKSYQYEADTITVTARGDVGHANYRKTRFCAIGRLLVLSSKFSCDLRFVTEYINNFVDFALESTGVPQLTAPQISKYSVPLPPTKSEQEAIAEALSDADALIESLERLISKKRHLKQGAMQELLTGKKRLPGFSGEWEVVSAGDIGRFRGGSGFPTKFQGATSGKYPFFKVSDMNNEGNETFMETANNYISESLRKQLGALVLPASSIVFAKVGAAVFLERKKILAQASCLDNNMAAYVLDPDRADCRFIHYVLLNTRLGDLVSTTALPSLSGNVLAAIELALPPFAEQTAIAAILSDMDAELTALEGKLAKARAIKQGMMQELLIGRIRLV